MYFEIDLKHTRDNKPSITELLEKGIILLDKPPRMSSHEASAFVKKILGIKKTGHTGTLDPNVSGLLIIGLNKATRFLEYLNTLDKKYVCLMRLYKKDVQLNELETIIKNNFLGKVLQEVPTMAAVKRQKRFRKIYYIKVLEIKHNSMTTDVLFEAHVEKGTYIRTLCEDIGKKFNCIGKMLELRRTAIGKFDEQNYRFITLHDLYYAHYRYVNLNDQEPLRNIIRPIEEFCEFEKLVIKNQFLKKAINGDLLYPEYFHNHEEIFKKDANWAELTSRLVPVGLLKVDEASLRKILTISTKK
ncbi:MAG: RNA-guided pseudouridylation complex pseudouridine synthase subunit Cbf5 [Candidatus Micrarchaeota archaeon]|nr:RNA-guided pseudouridylation complex pseudouridine synthase subunit Cbf5 [Candidatus Micrarchaeota archaeon]